MPLDAQNAKILELSARIIPYFGAVVRQKVASTGNSQIPRLFRETQGKPCLCLHTAAWRQNLTRKMDFDAVAEGD